MGGKGQDAADLAAFGPVLPGAGAVVAHRRVGMSMAAFHLLKEAK